MVRLLAGRGRLEVLAYLRRRPKPPPTMNELSRQLGVPLATTWHAVHDLEDLGLVFLERVGASALVRPNPSNPVWKSVSGLLDLELASPHRLAYDFFVARLKARLPNVDVHLFGSVRAGTYRPSSDVDVEVVFGGSGNARHDVQRVCVEVAQEAFDRFRMTVAAVVSSRRLVAAGA
ncbi:MAG TPA: nucleotidyltransferase domain-containing protein [Candidatus Thermoplasmatota archaeon]|nr:nucleotidyltransferase domain-containing protein [Candidatus Thermoplasmatota archaeon]